MELHAPQIQCFIEVQVDHLDDSANFVP